MRRRAQDDSYPQKRIVKEGTLKELCIPLQSGIDIYGPDLPVEPWVTPAAPGSSWLLLAPNAVYWIAEYKPLLN